MVSVLGGVTRLGFREVSRLKGLAMGLERSFFERLWQVLFGRFP